MIQTTASQRLTPPDEDWVKAVCKIGKGKECCRYLAVGGDGWTCEKHTPLGRTLDARVKANTMRAQSDNCMGRAPRLNVSSRDYK